VSGKRSTTISARDKTLSSASAPWAVSTPSIVFSERDQPRTSKLSAASIRAQAAPSSPRPSTATVRSRASGGALPARQMPS
jgi:hypothetical protein